jgi:hypothetical protein
VSAVLADLLLQTIGQVVLGTAAHGSGIPMRFYWESKAVLSGVFAILLGEQSGPVRVF